MFDCVEIVIRLIAHHSLSNSSHGSPNYYLLIRKVSLLLYNINTVRRFSLVRTFASNVIVVFNFSWFPVPTRRTAHIGLHTGAMFRIENHSGLAHTCRSLELSELVYYQMSPSFMS